MTFAGGDLRDKVRLDSNITLIDAENFDFDMNHQILHILRFFMATSLLNKCDLVES